MPSAARYSLAAAVKRRSSSTIRSRSPRTTGMKEASGRLGGERQLDARDQRLRRRLRARHAGAHLQEDLAADREGEAVVVLPRPQLRGHERQLLALFGGPSVRPQLDQVAAVPPRGRNLEPGLFGPAEPLD